jgi:LysR family transcriptional regulator for bpeEF and oprC
MDKLRALKFFCRVAETRSFAAAAFELDVVPSVLSKAIAALETDIDFKLFNRTTRRVSLTQNGTRYYDHCKKLLIELDEAELLERDGIARPAGKIVVGMHPAIHRMSMSRIDEFLTAYLETTITSTPATLLDDKLDLLVTLADLSNSSFGVRTIGTTRHVLAASPRYLEKNGIPRSPEDLRKHVFIVSGRPDGPSYARWTMKRGNQVQTVYVPVCMVSREGTYMYEACLCGAGITRQVELYIRAQFKCGTLVQVLPDWSLSSLPIRAVVPDNKKVPEKVRVLVEFLRTVLKDAKRP